MYYLSRVSATHEIQCVFDDCRNREKSNLLAVRVLSERVCYDVITLLLRFMRQYSSNVFCTDFSELMNSTSHTRENPFG